MYYLVGLHISDIGKEISSLVTCRGLWTATVRHSPEQKLLVQIPDCPLTWNLCIWKLGSKICREPRQKVFGTPPPVELHCKKGSLRLTELRPRRHLCSGIIILGKRIQHQA